MKKILIVEDDDDIRSLLESAMTSVGFLTLGADNGSSALKKITAFNPDLILSDLHMPEMNGAEFYKNIRRSFKNLPFIFLSGAADKYRDFVSDEWLRENSHFIPKPFDLTEIRTAIKTILENSTDEIL